MNELLITPREVAELVFGGEGPGCGMIAEADIASAQVKYLKPVLGPLYDVLVEGRYEDFVCKKLKLPLAMYVKSLVLRNSAVKIGVIGAVHNKGENFSPAGDVALAMAVKCLRADARDLLRNAVDYIECNKEMFPEYDPAENIWNTISIAGNIVI